ncbi:hypothetical protein N6L24_00760 [Cognatishimia sp. SS12]|uniref:hypothetical protein n=1 Tax=Cognatishimia sp. SS12 TaxID=2979465 RepID=UPI00232C2012|nr:hypothetical protein [Cognatishimia sp. SS12]MDC0736797.1 hypothetical protein [Cognatishimia sp. SS12]
MVTNNKVLTVSYGTFSCTLEGFEDSFDTMKAIAEYFRDLAADDRYFGAEPPTPDAEMLTRIAEREIERRVQARHEHGTLVLSAAAAAPAATEAAADTVAEKDAEPFEAEDKAVLTESQPEELTAEEAQAPQAAQSETPEVEAAEDDQPAESAEPEAEEHSAAPEMAVESAPEVEAAPEVAANVEPEVAADAEADEDVAAETDLEAEAEADDAEDMDAADNLFDEDFDAPKTAAPAAEATDDAEDSIAAKLRRIRAVVSRAGVDEDDEDDFIEDQHADDMAVAEAFDQHEDDAAEAQADDQQSDDQEDDADDADTLSVELPAAAAPAPSPRPRVIRMKRAEFEEAVADGLIEEDFDQADATPAAQTSLSDEDEADLMAQLAEVDAELNDEPLPLPASSRADLEVDTAEATPEAEAPAAAEDTAAPERVTPRRARRNRRAALEGQNAGEEAVDRLIEEANTKLDEPEGNRRRNAIAHLRAAVAATKAEKDAGKSLQKEDNSEAYRDDLASAMRPRQSEDGEKRSRRSTAPLKLVAAQRIDQPEEQAAKPVRPRRVAVEDVAPSETGEGPSDFAEFAESMGATQLPEVLEAAASYLTHVEGRARFSRPMLMRLAYQVGEDRLEREACLRSFGQLLREKKIEKIAGGRFTASDSINFKPDDNDREAG